MKVTMVNTPNELLAAINNIFPKYIFERDEGTELDFTYHALLQDFLVFFGGRNSEFTEGQLRDLGTLINLAVTAGGKLENAFGTCFLEHLGQVKAHKPLLPYLSSESKKRLHA